MKSLPLLFSAVALTLGLTASAQKQKSKIKEKDQPKVEEVRVVPALPDSPTATMPEIAPAVEMNEPGKENQEKAPPPPPELPKTGVHGDFTIPPPPPPAPPAKKRETSR